MYNPLLWCTMNKTFLQILFLICSLTICMPLVMAAADFSGTPTSGLVPLTVQFTDSSTNSPTSWAWLFGDENYTASWTQQNASAGWSQRNSHTSIILPDDSLLIMGGYDTYDFDNMIYNCNNNVWRSSDNGTSWAEVNASAGWQERFSHSSVLLRDGSIVIMGGADFYGSSLNDVWRSTDDGTNLDRGEC